MSHKSASIISGDSKMAEQEKTRDDILVDHINPGALKGSPHYHEYKALYEYAARMEIALQGIVETQRVLTEGMTEQDYREWSHLDGDTEMTSDCIWGLTGVETSSTPTMKGYNLD